MDRRAQAHQLAEVLAPCIPRALELQEPPDANWVEALPLSTNQLVTVAVLRELRRLASGAAETQSQNGGSPNGGSNGAVPSTPLQRTLEAELAKPVSASRDLLWLLLARSDVEWTGPEAAPGGLERTARWKRLRAWSDHGWIRRQIVALAINAIIVVVVVLMASLQYDLGWTWQNWLDVGVFKLFAIWALSFLPGWLFVRFLGQRAAALWWDFVLALHRLGADEPQYLPEPPLDSRYHRTWLEAGGAPLKHAGNIYQEKFDAYYGKSVSRVGAQSTLRVHAETLFPVFLLSAILSASWTAVLWNTSFASAPGGPGDTLKFAFLGAYAFIAQMLMRRFFQNDLKASAYASSVVRLFVVAIVVVTAHQIPGLSARPGLEAVVAFIIGFFPLVGMQFLQRVAAATIRGAVPSLNPAYPLSQIDGLNVWYEARLLEEGIEDMQNLTTANIVDVILHTHVPVGRLVDWIDQAYLYQHLDRTERGFVEVHRARKAPRTAAATTDQRGRTEQDPALGSAAGSHQAGESSTAFRPGSRSRHLLRTLGIRTATDLLKLQPADAHLPEDGWEWVEPAGLEPHSVSALGRLLAQEPGINLIWNWQKGAAQVRS
jgi:hypothetical protein